MQLNVPPTKPEPVDDAASSFFSEMYGHVEKTGKVSFVVLALLFALGLLVTNTYLLQFGLSEFGLLRARFVLTGVLASFPTVVNVGCLALAYVVTRDVNARFANKSRHVKDGADLVILLAIGALLPIVVLGVVFRKAEFTDSQIFDALLLWSIGFLPILPFSLVAADRMIRAYRHRHTGLFELETELLAPPRSSRFKLPLMISIVLSAIGLLISGLLYVELFVRHVYPNVPEQFGGGQPHQVQLLFRPDSVEDVARMHIPIEPGATLSEPVTLLWHGNSGLMVRVMYEGEDYVILLDGSQVTAIILEVDD